MFVRDAELSSLRHHRASVPPGEVISFLVRAHIPRLRHRDREDAWVLPAMAQCDDPETDEHVRPDGDEALPADCGRVVARQRERINENAAPRSQREAMFEEIRRLPPRRHSPYPRAALLRSLLLEAHPLRTSPPAPLSVLGAAISAPETAH